MNDSCQTYYLNYNSVILEIKSDFDFDKAIKKHFPHSFFCHPPKGLASFRVAINESVINPEGEYHRIVNRSLNNASLDCWVDLESRRCILSKINAQSHHDKERLLCFFCSNLFEKLIENEGFISFHCSCVAKGDQVVAFLGERMSGKTTAELMLLNNGYNLLNNDCALFGYSSADQKIDVVGVIEDVFIREKSGFYEMISENHKKCSALVNIDMKTSMRRLVLSHSDLACCNNVEWVGKGKLCAMVFPLYNPKTEKIRIKEVHGNVVQTIMQHRIEIGHESTDFLDQYFNNDVCEKILLDKMQEIPCFSCEFNEKMENELCKFADSIVEGCLL